MNCEKGVSNVVLDKVEMSILQSVSKNLVTVSAISALQLMVRRYRYSDIPERESLNEYIPFPNNWFNSASLKDFY